MNNYPNAQLHEGLSELSCPKSRSCFAVDTLFPPALLYDATALLFHSLSYRASAASLADPPAPCCLSHPFSISFPSPSRRAPRAGGSGGSSCRLCGSPAARASRPSFPRAAPEQPARSCWAGRATERRWGGLSGCRCAAASGWGHSGERGLGRGFRRAGRQQL